MSALPSTLKARDCTHVPLGTDANVLTGIYKVALSRGVTDSKLFPLSLCEDHFSDIFPFLISEVMLSMFETAWVESRVNDLNCGDQDSVGESYNLAQPQSDSHRIHRLHV